MITMRWNLARILKHCPIHRSLICHAVRCHQVRHLIPANFSGNGLSLEVTWKKKSGETTHLVNGAWLNKEIHTKRSTKRLECHLARGSCFVFPHPPARITVPVLWTTHYQETLDTWRFSFCSNNITNHECLMYIPHRHKSMQASRVSCSNTSEYLRPEHITQTLFAQNMIVRLLNGFPLLSFLVN